MKVINGYYKIYNFFHIKLFDLLYGKKFRHGKIVCRRNLSILIEKNGMLSIGTGCFFNNDCSITSLNKIVIGNNTLFGENVKIYDHNYHINTKDLIKRSGHVCGEVIIGDNCWIGSNSVILKGASIGNNCVIGAGCIINNKIDDNMLVINDNSLKVIPLDRK